MLQGRLISWAPHRKLGAHANFSDRVLLAPRRPTTVPGYPAGLHVRSFIKISSYFICTLLAPRHQATVPGYPAGLHVGTISEEIRYVPFVDINRLQFLLAPRWPATIPAALHVGPYVSAASLESRYQTTVLEIITDDDPFCCSVRRMQYRILSCGRRGLRRLQSS